MTDKTYNQLLEELNTLRAANNVVKWRDEKARADTLLAKVRYQHNEIVERDKQIEVLLSKHDSHAKQAILNMEANARAYRAEKRLHILAEKSAELIDAMDKGVHQLGELDEYAALVKELMTSNTTEENTV